MGKRLYVAVGSVGVKCLMELIRRYQDEGFYKDTQDMFIGMDTDRGFVSRLKALDKDNSHIEAIHVVHEDMDSPVRDVIGFFRKNWDKRALIPMTGVGGDRKLSFSTLKWTQNLMLQRWVASLSPEDELILIGTAFGGTSTGMFWNAALWLRASLLRDANRHCAEFYAFLVLPGDQGGDLAKYPWSYNLCAFMQDMQTLEFSQRVQRRMQADIPCRIPLFALYNPAEGSDLLPVWSEERFGSSDHTFIPFDRLFLVPTPEAAIGNESHIPDIVAEQAFVLGALDGWKDFRVTAQTIDLMNTAHGADYRKPDYAFGGFNMVVGRSARRTALSAIFWKHFREQYKLFVSSGVKSGSPDVMAELQRKARQYICDGNRVTQLVDTHRYKATQLLDNPKLSPTEASGQLAVVCKDVQDTLRTQPYVWVGFTEFVHLCSKWLQPEINRNPDAFVTLADLHGIYLAIRDELKREASQLSDVRVRILDLPAKCRQIARVRSAKTATRLLGAQEVVDSEVQNEYRRAEKEYFEWYLSCCRADATKNQLATDADVVSELRTLVQSYDQRFKLMLESSAVQMQQMSLPSCIYQDKNAPADASLTLNVSRGRYLLMMLEGVKSDEAGIRTDADGWERRTVVELGEQATVLGPANPLKKITLDFSTGHLPKAFSDVFKVGDANEWHHHFFIRTGNVAPFTWGTLSAFSPAFETFRPQGVPIAEGQNVEVALLKGNHITARDTTNSESQGAWLGTVQLDADIRSIIKHTYERIGKPIHVWQQRAYSAVAQGAPQRSLLTLPEMLAFGVILGCIDEHTKLNKELGARGCMIRFEKAGVDLRVVPDEVSLYFTHTDSPERAYLMVNINTKWIAPLMGWIDGSFWADVGMEEFRNRLVELERSILEKMTLALSEEDFRKPMLMLAAKVRAILHVNLC